MLQPIAAGAIGGRELGELATLFLLTSLYLIFTVRRINASK